MDIQLAARTRFRAGGVRRRFRACGAAFVRDVDPNLHARGYAVYPLVHRTLLGKPRTPEQKPPDDPALAPLDPRFSCQRADVF